MKKETLLIISIILILLTIILSTTQKNIYEGDLKRITVYEKRTIILLEDFEEEFILFDKIEINSCTHLKIEGKEDTYKNKKQIIVDKITCLN